MKHINKTTSVSLEAERKLNDWRDNFVYQRHNYSEHLPTNTQYNGKKFNELCNSGMTTPNLWDLHGGDAAAVYTRKLLKVDLAKEQDSLCCYCCDTLEGEDAEKDFNDVLEHFLDKGSDRCGKMYTYKNLLLACHGNRHKFVRTERGDTWAILAARFNTTENALRSEVKNSHLPSSLAHGTKVKIPNLPQHCDVTKWQHPININPVTDVDCWKKFIYKSDGSIQGINKDAQDVVKKLELDVDKFRERRKEVWDLAKQAYGEDEYVQIHIEKRDIQAIFDYFKCDAFCVVYWAYFAKQLNIS